MKCNEELERKIRQNLSYNPDTGMFTRLRGAGGYPAYTIAGTTSSYFGYVAISVDQVQFKAHRLAFLFMTGELPDEGMEVDHIDGDRKNNRWENLRLVTRGENARNCARRSDNRSGSVGVGFHKGRGQWRARLAKKHLGWFLTKEEAIEAREAAEEGAEGFTDRHGSGESLFPNKFVKGE